MRVLKALFIISLIFISCSQNNSITIDDDLNEKIKKIIVAYDEHINKSDNNSFDPPIYEVSFKVYEGICYVIINTNNIYHSQLDGYIFINNKLVTFNNTSSNCNKNFVIIEKEVDFKGLKDYYDENEPADNYDPSIWEFKIENGNLIPVGVNKLKIDF